MIVVYVFAGLAVIALIGIAANMAASGKAKTPPPARNMAKVQPEEPIIEDEPDNNPTQDPATNNRNFDKFEADPF